MTWRCVQCGQRFTAYSVAQRHANEAGHIRLEIEFPDPQPEL